MNDDTIGLRFRFRGARNYVQSADMAAALTNDVLDGMSETGGARPFLSRLQINRPIGHHCVLVLSNKNGSRPAAMAEWTRVLDDGTARTHQRYIFETNEPVDVREGYDEAPMEQVLAIRPSAGEGVNWQASMPQVPGYSALDEVVFAHKMLCHAIVGHTRIKWLAAQFGFERPLPSTFERLEIQPLRVVAPKFVSSGFAFDGEACGEMLFIAQGEV